MRCIGRSVRLVAARQRFLASREVHVAEHPAEQGQRGEGLVKGDFVAGFVDPQEAEVAVLPHLAVLGAIDYKGCVVCGSELCRVSVIDLE